MSVMSVKTHLALRRDRILVETAFFDVRFAVGLTQQNSTFRHWNSSWTQPQKNFGVANKANESAFVWNSETKSVEELCSLLVDTHLIQWFMLLNAIIIYLTVANIYNCSANVW